MYLPLIIQEIDEINKAREIKKLKKLNEEKDKTIQEKDKSIQEKDDIINKLSEENKKYKSLLDSLNVKNKEKTEDKSSDDIDYYEDENDEDSVIIGEEQIYED